TIGDVVDQSPCLDGVAGYQVAVVEADTILIAGQGAGAGGRISSCAGGPAIDLSIDGEDADPVGGCVAAAPIALIGLCPSGCCGQDDEGEAKGESAHVVRVPVRTDGFKRRGGSALREREFWRAPAGAGGGAAWNSRAAWRSQPDRLDK